MDHPPDDKRTSSSSACPLLEDVAVERVHVDLVQGLDVAAASRDGDASLAGAVGDDRRLVESPSEQVRASQVGGGEDVQEEYGLLSDQGVALAGEVVERL